MPGVSANRVAYLPPLVHQVWPHSNAETTSRSTSYVHYCIIKSIYTSCFIIYCTLFLCLQRRIIIQLFCFCVCRTFHIHAFIYSINTSLLYASLYTLSYPNTSLSMQYLRQHEIVLLTDNIFCCIYVHTHNINCLSCRNPSQHYTNLCILIKGCLDHVDVGKLL